MNSNHSKILVIERFTINDLHQIRTLVGDAARRVGLTESRARNLVTAVNEVAVNAIRHAGGHGWLNVDPSPAGVLVEVRDEGPGLGTDSDGIRPPAEAIGGRGLWLVRELCRQVTISTDCHGMTVRLFMPRI